MAKKITGYLKLQVPAGSATPSPPIGPALGQRGLNIMQFVTEFNAATQGMEPGMPVPVVDGCTRRPVCGIPNSGGTDSSRDHPVLLVVWTEMCSNVRLMGRSKASNKHVCLVECNSVYYIS